MPVRFPWWQPVPYLQRVHTGASKNTAIIQELRSQHEQLCHNKARMWNFTNSLLHRSGLATPTEDGNCNKQRYKRKRRQAVPRYIRGTQTESVVLSDGSVLRYAMSQRQADTQNTKSNIPPVWKTFGISRGVKDICNTSTPQSLWQDTKKYSTELGKEKKTPHVAKVILHRAYAEKRKNTHQRVRKKN